MCAETEFRCHVGMVSSRFRNTFHWLVKTSLTLTWCAVQHTQFVCRFSISATSVKLFVWSCLTVYRKLVPFSAINDFISSLLLPQFDRIYAHFSLQIFCAVLVAWLLLLLLQLFHLLFFPPIFTSWTKFFVHVLLHFANLTRFGI